MKLLLLCTALTAAAALPLRAADGVLLPFKEVTVSSAVSGILAEVNVKEGDAVVADQLLARLIDRVEAKEAERFAKVLEQKEFAARPKSWRSMRAERCISVAMTSSPPSSTTPSPRRMSVPRPAMLVASVTAPRRPACSTICASSR